MKPWLILIVVAVAATITASAALPMIRDDSSASRPRTDFAAPVVTTTDVPDATVDGDLNYKFGVMAHMTKGNHSWSFRNTGKKTLELRNLGTDCSCTIAQLGKDGAEEGKKTMLPVEPGASAPIELSWTTKTTGNFRKSARIGTNDPRKPEIVLSIEGKVDPAITVIPSDQAVSFQTVTNDEDVVRVVVLYSKDRPDMKVTRVVSSNPALLATSLRPMTTAYVNGDAETGQMVEITLKAGNKLGPIREEILIMTDHPEKPEVNLKVSGQVTGPISFIPDRATLRGATTRAGGSMIERIWVRGRTATHFTVASAPAGISADFEPIPQGGDVKGSMYKMTVRVAPGTPAGHLTGDLVLKTDHPHAAEVHLPVDAIVQGQD